MFEISTTLKNNEKMKNTSTDISKIARNVLYDTSKFSCRKITNDDIKLSTITNKEKEKNLFFLRLSTLHFLSKDSIHYSRYTYYDKQVRHVNEFFRHVRPDKSPEYHS